MRDAVRDAWVDFNTPLEGMVTKMYADVLGLVTVGMGNLIDPIESALGLPWELPAGIPANRSEVAAAWNAVKSDPKAAKLGWKYAAGIPANRVRLSVGNVEALILQRLDANDKILAERFTDWDDRPADAQMAAHSMSWAMGPYFPRKFPRFSGSFSKGDYASAAVECAISPAAGTVVERNKLNRRLLLAAARPGADPAVLSWSRPS